MKVRFLLMFLIAVSLMGCIGEKGVTKWIEKNKDFTVIDTVILYEVDTVIVALGGDTMRNIIDLQNVDTVFVMENDRQKVEVKVLKEAVTSHNKEPPSFIPPRFIEITTTVKPDTVTIHINDTVRMYVNVPVLVKEKVVKEKVVKQKRSRKKGKWWFFGVLAIVLIIRFTIYDFVRDILKTIFK